MNSLDILGEVTAEAAIDFTRWGSWNASHRHGTSPREWSTPKEITMT